MLVDDEYDNLDDMAIARWLQDEEAVYVRGEEDWMALLYGAALLFYGEEEARRIRAERRFERRLYLTRPDILSNPRSDTPLQALYNSRSDRAFITTMGFDVSSFELILASGFQEMWDTIPIPRNDVPLVFHEHLGVL
jgi:hypothetical protein